MQLTPHHIGIIVGDLERSKAFYRTLGFEQRDEHVSDDKTISFMELAGMRVELFAYREQVPVADAPARVRGFRHFALETPDIDSTLADLKAAGVVDADAAILELPAGWRLLFFHDPDGVEIEVKQVD